MVRACVVLNALRRLQGEDPFIEHWHRRAFKNVVAVGWSSCITSGCRWLRLLRVLPLVERCLILPHGERRVREAVGVLPVAPQQQEPLEAIKLLERALAGCKALFELALVALLHAEAIHRDVALAREGRLAICHHLAPPSTGRRLWDNRDWKRAFPHRSFGFSLGVHCRRNQHRCDAADSAAAVRLLEGVARLPRVERVRSLPHGA
mmetsp:Transcript_25804/g.62328  ORF Transcript_25804/g.62328 Transcript_25804/m.62328 type:complete len:206 (+) Transcript_25804:153-770(+)